MQHSKFEKLWEGIQPLQCLKRMDLSASEYLKKIPDLSKATSLEELDLSGCKSLLELTSSIGNATKLRICKLKGCLLLKELPSSIGRTWIEEIPPWIEKLFRLRKLIMYGCEKLKTISRNISKLENLEVLGLSFGDSRDFVGGDWRSGGTCHIETPPDFGASLVPSGHGNIQEKFKDAAAGPAPVHTQDCNSSVSLEFLICGMSSFLRCLLSMKVLQDQTMVIQINIVW
ncbi:hypothetical protein Bca52824_051118 [Brassica carinata]|uniref:Disease resistance protein n=1 Tax=Brassica carinata TaxID=52824 RepID=A0A8X7R2B6_BRACI|nr:hypothetical protein Bca52824_051118 [Brassica carinata]